MNRKQDDSSTVQHSRDHSNWKCDPQGNKSELLINIGHQSHSSVFPTWYNKPTRISTCISKVMEAYEKKTKKTKQQQHNDQLAPHLF